MPLAISSATWRSYHARTLQATERTAQGHAVFAILRADTGEWWSVTRNAGQRQGVLRGCVPQVLALQCLLHCLYSRRGPWSCGGWARFPPLIRMASFPNRSGDAFVA